MDFYIRHYLEPFDYITKTQRCAICKEVIHDYSNGLTETEDGSTIIEAGWNSGEHFVKEGNPTYYTTSIGDNDLSSMCNAVFDKKYKGAVSDETKAEWKEKTQKAKEVGTKFHQDIENQLKSNQLLNTDFCNNNILNKAMNNKQVAIGVKMIAFEAMTLLMYNSLRGWDIPADENPETEGYLIEYLGQGNPNHSQYDNYISWTPKDIFEASYLPIETNDKISKSDVESFMVQGVPTKLGAKTTALTVTTLTGFDIIGTASCVDPANYDIEIGADIAKREVVDKLWGHLGFVLQWAKNGLKAKASN